MARKWQKLSALGRKRIISNPTIDHETAETLALLYIGDSSLPAKKGHFVIYTTDCKRFAMPLAYLGNNIFQELFKISMEEFGFASDRPIVLPCDSVFMNYIVLVLQRGISKDFEKTLINFITTRHSPLSHSFGHGHQPIICL
ncbi:hypothetical protein Tsubulata_024787 [Turnera subulata]|uniref:Uncharacterized protein n=1 Tax=Turnera subulata TaxID=218843 RepID=A0A9Q0GDS5_9ROSI|nr:hypothetical protein Tsubulata_024787 [Turnera subulata]